MKKFTEKTLEEAIASACKELNVTEDKLNYTIEEEKKGIFIKKCTIAVAEITDVVEFAETYLTDVCHALGFEVSLKSFVKDDIIKILLETNHNSILIGKNGNTLQSLNELTKLAVSAKFKKKFRLLLDIGDYKDRKYNKVIHIAKDAAKEVLKTHASIKLDSMTPDERKKVHNALASWKNIKSDSIGDGKDRAIVISYVGNATVSEPVKSTNNEETKQD
jgi:spoIIIJ-associated protein